MNDNLTDNTNQPQDPEQALKNIVSGNINSVVPDETRKVKMVERGLRIPNIVLRKTVEKLRAKGLSDAQIIEKILFFDDLAEKGELLSYLDRQKREKEKKNQGESK